MVFFGDFTKNVWFSVVGKFLISGGWPVALWKILMAIIWLMMVNNYLVGGWPSPLKNDGVKVSWDDDIPNMMGKS